MDPLRHGVNLRPELRAAGVTDRQLRLLRRGGQVDAVRRGAYAAGLDGPLERHRAAATAAIAQLGPGTVLSHVTAAVLHGLPLWQTALTRVHATRNRRSGARRGDTLVLHAAALDADEMVQVDGLSVTSLPRTLADLARLLPFEEALVPADSALHRHLVTRAELDVALTRSLRRPGNAAARQVLAFARPGATNPGESRSRLAIHRAGLPVPALQERIRTARGTYETDFWWKDVATVGEFDGRVKYGRLLKPGQDAGEVVFAEKLREDSLRAAGCEVVRWTWAELADFDTVVSRLHEAFARRRSA
jgi:hypothetical protein